MQLLHARYDDEAFVVVVRRPAVDQGGQWLEHRAPDRPGRSPHRVGGGPVGHRQPDQGSGRPGRAVRQSGPGPARGRRAAGGGGVPVSITTPDGFVAAGVAAGHQGIRGARPGAPRHRRRASGPDRRHLHPEPGLCGSGPGQSGPPGGQRRSGGRRRWCRAATPTRPPATGVGPMPPPCAGWPPTGSAWPTDQVLVCSTGLIGIPLPMDADRGGHPAAGGRPGRWARCRRRRGPGHPDHRLRPQGGAGHVPDLHAWPGWPRGRACWRPTWRPCWPS